MRSRIRKRDRLGQLQSRLYLQYFEHTSIAYYRSSPRYHAEGLQGDLLMLHGMVDRTVHFQDVLRISQRFIELGKDHWELAVFPMEDHGFAESSSWTDEYKRIYRLFERILYSRFQGINNRASRMKIS
jgi:dipeptidyl aminopeptidase/acylaminoacyl peptidase